MGQRYSYQFLEKSSPQKVSKKEESAFIALALSSLILRGSITAAAFCLSSSQGLNDEIHSTGSGSKNRCPKISASSGMEISAARCPSFPLLLTRKGSDLWYAAISF